MQQLSSLSFIWSLIYSYPMVSHDSSYNVMYFYKGKCKKLNRKIDDQALGLHHLLLLFLSFFPLDSISFFGFLMIFFLVMPGLFGGFGNYFVPIFQGSPEVVYPRVNNFSILILILSYLFVILSLISEFGGGTGWTLYPPLSTSFMSLSPSSTAVMVFGLLMSGISSSLTSVNFWRTIINLRSYYLSLKTIPLFPWSLFVTGGMLLLTLPILSGALLMVLG